MRSWRLSLGTGVALSLAAGGAPAFMPDETSSSLRIPLPAYQMAQSPFAASLTDPLSERHGGTWHIGQWNRSSGTPQSIYGSGVELAPGGLTTDAVAEAAARAFLATNVDVLGARVEDLSLDAVIRTGNKVAVHFDQLHHGVPVEFSDVVTVSLDTGRLYFIRSQFYGDIDVEPTPRIGSTQAQTIAERAVDFDIATDAAEGDPVLRVLPIPLSEGGSRYHLVWKVRSTLADPYAIWVSYVDAHSGQVVHRYNDVQHLYSGTMQGEVDDHSYCMGFSTLPFRGMDVTVSDAGTATTEGDGSWSIEAESGDQTLTAGFEGPVTHIVNYGMPFGTVSVPISEDVPVIVDWNDDNSDPAERTAFYWINEAMAWVRTIDADYDHCHYQTIVNFPSSCNATWGPCQMIFFRADNGCGNTGRMGGALVHEFGHGVQYDLIGSQGNQGLGEGNADCLAQFLTDDSVIARGFILDDCSQGIRDCNNALQYPDDVIGHNIHDAGRVMCGVTWDLRQELQVVYGDVTGKQLAGEIWYYARKLCRPTTQPEQVLSYFVYDDDDGNLDNGTPNHDSICAAALNHGFECPEILTGVLIAHEPLGSTTDHVDPYPVEASIISTEGAVATTSMFYRVNGGAFTEVAMSDDGGDQYSADIPPQAMDADIDYYISAMDDLGNGRTSPENAPTDTHTFGVASIIDDLESGAGWTAGLPGDDAIAGKWELIDPNPTAAQPGDDHTSDPGVLCFVTGQCDPGCDLTESDVDAGSTTLLSPVWDLSSVTNTAQIRYWRWYSNYTGENANDDSWVVDVSNDGGSSWTSVENVNPPNAAQNTWVEVEIDLIALFGTPDQVQLRFIASDLGDDSIIEAAVDDVAVLADPRLIGVANEVAGADGPVTFTLHAAHPNPFNPVTTLSYDVPADGVVRMEIYDTAGRVIRTLIAGFVEAGSHAMRWDGRSDDGAPASSGVYYLRVTSAAGVQTQKLTLLK